MCSSNHKFWKGHQVSRHSSTHAKGSLRWDYRFLLMLSVVLWWYKSLRWFGGSSNRFREDI